VAAIREVFSGPLMVDADTGFGNAMNMVRTVKLLERAGADAIQIEDQVFPKRCGHFDGKEVVATAEMVAKVRAAVDARRDPGVLYANVALQSAVHGMQLALGALREHGQLGDAGVLAVDFAERQRLVGKAEFDALERKYKF